MLYVVSTPIGNLEDITLRAITTLKNADYIACEDTRKTRVLLDKYQIKSSLISYHQHSSLKKENQIIGLLKEGKDIALVTDAGTPGISDPGSRLISEAIENNIEVTGIPGPAAFVTALSISGFDTSSFLYVGFLPNKKGRQTKIRVISEEKRTVVLYESVYRIKKLLSELVETMPERNLCVVRELTKKFEEIYRGKPAEIIPKVKEKGEFVVVVEGKQ